MPPFAGSVVAYATAFAVAYTAQRAWTFGARHRHGHALPRYFIIQVGCALMSGGLAHVLVIYLQMSPLAMSVAITAASSVGQLPAVVAVGLRCGRPQPIAGAEITGFTVC